MSSPAASAAPQQTAEDQAQPPHPSPGDLPHPTATNNSPRVWLISSACSPLVVRLIRRLLAHGDYVAACLPPLELDDPARSRDFRNLIAECNSTNGTATATATATGSTDDGVEDQQDTAGWKDRIRSIKADGRSMGQCGAAVAEAIDVFGRIDIVLCCNSEAIIGTVEELAVSEASRMLIQDQFETIFFSQVNLIKAVLPRLRAQHNGHIVVLTSIGGHIGTPEMSIHTAATWAIEGFCDSLAYEVAPFNVRVTIVQPHKEISMLTNRIVFAPALQQDGTEGSAGGAAADSHLSVPSVRSMLARVLSLDPETAVPGGSLAPGQAARSTGSPDSPVLTYSPSSSTSPPASTPASRSTIATPAQTQQQQQHTDTPGSTGYGNDRGRGGSRIVSRYPQLPESSLDALVNETVTALVAIGGHENPPARHIVGFEGADAVKEKLRNVTEELEDFYEASISVDIFVERDDAAAAVAAGGAYAGGGRDSGADQSGSGNIGFEGMRGGGAGGLSGGELPGSSTSYVDGGGGQMDWDGGSLW